MAGEGGRQGQQDSWDSNIPVTESNLGQLALCSKVNLLTLGCGEGKCSVYCKAKQRVWAANVQKT